MIFIKSRFKQVQAGSSVLNMNYHSVSFSCLTRLDEEFSCAIRMEAEISYEVLCAELLSGVSIAEISERSYAELDEETLEQIEKEIRKRFLPHFTQKLKSVYHNREKFLKKFGESGSGWLQGKFTINLPGDKAVSPPPVTSSGGRPTKEFVDCSERSKQHKVQNLRASFSQPLIDAAAAPTFKQNSSVYDPEQALALFIRLQLSKFQYQVLHAACKKIGHDIFPAYNHILAAKKKCYPEGVKVSEAGAEVPLQSLLDHTSNRIVKTLEDEDRLKIGNRELLLHCKWGFDGASGQSTYMQKFSHDFQQVSDSNLFMTSIVPLKITLAEDENFSVWINPRLSSTSYCRALRFQVAKEIPDLIKQEKQQVDGEIEKLRHSECTFGDHTIRVKHRLSFTMIDGKVAQIVTGTTSSSNCVVCGARPTQMNDLTAVMVSPANEDALQLGMSPLHVRMKCMEYLLHLAYNLPFKAWRTDKFTQQIKEETKMSIQNEFRERTGLLVDFVKQGSGTSNTGNTARRFFEDPAISAEIIGIDEALIHRLGILLQVICCSEVVGSSKFEAYAADTAKLAVEK